VGALALEDARLVCAFHGVGPLGCGAAALAAKWRATLLPSGEPCQPKNDGRNGGSAW
jgi:hypothetical protein